MSHQFPMSDLARKDLFVCLGIWLTFEIVCFALLPTLRAPSQQGITELWFTISFPLGIGGACLIASSTELTLFTEAQRKAIWKFLLSLLASAIAWLGLLGIAFPLLIISIQVFNKLFDLFQT